MTVKFITVKGPDRLARAPFYLGIPQHERTMSKREAYEHIALALAADGTFTMEGADGSYVAEADIPQKLPNGTMSFSVRRFPDEWLRQA